MVRMAATTMIIVIMVVVTTAMMRSTMTMERILSLVPHDAI